MKAIFCKTLKYSLKFQVAPSTSLFERYTCNSVGRQVAAYNFFVFVICIK